MCIPVYDARDTRYKSPYGAVSSGTTVYFTLRPRRAEGISRAVLHAQFEQRSNETVHIPMPWQDTQAGIDTFSCTLDTRNYVGLIWYYFTLERLDGGCRELEVHQLTVYDGSESVPTWFGEGVTYQIFPDRFRRTRIPDPTGLVGDRTVHRRWNEEPNWQPDEHGEVRNRDFFGGDLAGIIEKLDYLKALGVDTLYLCPIFEAAENHRYGTADYTRIDPMLGTLSDFEHLCTEVHRRGMRLILDGVFNHTGYVSRYFNGDGFYPDPGAANSQDSPYRNWFHFTRWPDQYDCWWGIYSLPAVNESDPSYRNFIFSGQNSVVRRWLRAGVDGWRLDVADELPDDFVRGIHQAVREENPDAVIIGEVWEDGSNKIAYDVRRKHLWGGHCDGLMNYPFRTAVLDYLLGGDASEFVQSMETLRENYPDFAWRGAMNALGTHDTPRLLTLLGTGGTHSEKSKAWRSTCRLSPGQRRQGVRRLKLGTAILYCFPGSPTIYYGDEAGMEGFEDPFNRRTFPWGHEDKELLDWFSSLGALRAKYPALRRGGLRYVAGKGNLLAFVRHLEGQSILCACNTGAQDVRLPCTGRILLGDGTLKGGALVLPPESTAIVAL